MEENKGAAPDGLEFFDFSSFTKDEYWQQLQNGMTSPSDANLGQSGYSPQGEPHAPVEDYNFGQSVTPTGYEAAPGSLLEPLGYGLDNNTSMAQGTFDSGHGALSSLTAGYSPPAGMSMYPSPPQIIHDGLAPEPITYGAAQDSRVNRGMSHPHPTLLEPSSPAALHNILLPSAYPSTYSSIGNSQYLPLPVTASSSSAKPQQQPQQQKQEKKQALWAYAFDVLPADLQDPAVVEHTLAVDKRLQLKRLADFRFRLIASPAFGNRIARRFILPKRLRQDDRTRLLFMQVFNGNRQYNSKLPGYEFKMVQVFESRQFHSSGEDYQAMVGLAEGDGVDGLDRFDDHDIADLTAFPSPPQTAQDIDLEHLPVIAATTATTPGPLPTPKDDTDPHPITQRSRPIPKPDRVARKNAQGKYECDYPDCTEVQKSFHRKCEYNKHMDKHERPYKCLAEGCEKLSGFTYSGGLLRHEREVHAKHGGPRNPLNCPHGNCKRHAGKGFSRLENLNEHLRRVHTNSNPLASSPEPAEDGDSVAASETGQSISAAMQFQSVSHALPSPQVASVLPQKRALEDSENDGPAEVKRLRKTEETLTRINAELSHQLSSYKQQAELAAATQESQRTEIEAQKRQIMAMMGEMTAMRAQMTQVGAHVEEPSTLTSLTHGSFP